MATSEEVAEWNAELRKHETEDTWDEIGRIAGIKYPREVHVEGGLKFEGFPRRASDAVEEKVSEAEDTPTDIECTEETPTDSEYADDPPTFTGSDDDKDTDFRNPHGADYMTNEGMAETTGERPNDHQERSLMFPRWQEKYNPENEERSPEVVERISSNPEFETDMAHYQALFNGRATEEVAEEMGIDANTLTKRFTAARETKNFFHGIDLEAVRGKAYVVVKLNGKNEVKILGNSPMPYEEAQEALRKARKKTQKASLKRIRRQARKEKWNATRRREEAEAEIRGIEEAYALAYTPLTMVEGQRVHTSR
jgi:hypothetical protein